MLRLYDADVMRFLSVDPLAADFAAWSAFNYVLGNPLVFVDPDGRSADDIILRGSAENQQKTLEELSKLTNDKLVKSRDGKVRIISKGTENQGRDLSSGTKLISDLINDNNTTFISHSLAGSGTEALLNGKRVNAAQIKIGQEYDSDIAVNFNSPVRTVNADGTRGGVGVEIRLAHELGHAHINGAGMNEKTHITAFDPDQNKFITNADRTEIRSREMENAIRHEQKVISRAQMVTPEQLRILSRSMH